MQGRSWLNSSFTLIVVLGILVLMTVSLVKTTIQKKEENYQLQVLKKEIEKLESRKAQLTHLLDYLKTPEYAEKEAKKNLGLKKIGEEVITVLPSPNATSSLQEKEKFSLPPLLSSSDKEKPNPIKWWYYFFNKR